jgi:hypothetical protein
MYHFLDRKLLGGSLRLPEKKRLELRAQDLAVKKELGSDKGWRGWRTKKKVFMVVGGELSALIVVAWVVSEMRSACLEGVDEVLIV